VQHCPSLGRHDTFTCERWMLLQVCPGAFDATVPGVFDLVFRAILDAYHDRTPVIPLPNLERLLQDRFRRVQGQISSYTSDSLMGRLLILSSWQVVKGYRGPFACATLVKENFMGPLSRYHSWRPTRYHSWRRLNSQGVPLFSCLLTHFFPHHPPSTFPPSPSPFILPPLGVIGILLQNKNINLF
jgi:hypothetical protein